MAVRPLVTTGVALLSAGALVAGTPALFVPRDEITVAASTAEVPAQRTLTAEQINLLSVSLEGALAAFNDGYGGYYYQGTVTATAYVKEGDKLVEAAYDADGTAVLYDADGYQLYGADVKGNLVPVTTADLNADGSPVQFYWSNGYAATEPDPGNCSATGALCHDGFTGLAYYLSDNILPLDVVDNIFFEAGVTEFAYLGSVIAAAAVDAFDPTQKLQLSKRVDEFFSGGASLVAYSVINDNLPDDAVGDWVKGLNYSFFDGGVTSVVNYVVETVKALTAPQDPEEDGAGLSLLSAAEKTEAETETEFGVTSTTLPNLSKLLSLPTPKFDVESPFKKLAEQIEAPAESKLVKTLGVKEESTVDDVDVDGATDAIVPVSEVSKPTASTFDLPNLPKLNLGLTPKVEEKEVKEVKEPAAEEKSTDEETPADGEKTSEEQPGKGQAGAEQSAGSQQTDAGAAAGSSKKYTPKSRTTERKKTAGQKFVEKATKNLEKAFKPTTTAGAGKHEPAKSAGGAGASSASSAGSASANGSGANSGTGSNDNKSNGDTKSNKDK